MKLPDVDLHDFAVTLYDNKGRRTHPRAHILPLQGRALDIINKRYDDHLGGEYLLTTDGKTHLSIDTLSRAVRNISSNMVKEKTAREPFQMKDIRRTAETLLAGMGISRELRGQLQSHGLGGVQARHYDQHDYMKEKKNILQAWEERLLEMTTENNVDIYAHL